MIAMIQEGKKESRRKKKSLLSTTKPNGVAHNSSRVQLEIPCKMSWRHSRLTHLHAQEKCSAVDSTIGGRDLAGGISAGEEQRLAREERVDRQEMSICVYRMGVFQTARSSGTYGRRYHRIAQWLPGAFALDAPDADVRQHSSGMRRRCDALSR
ncbi:hypothetical protein K461DRAFT_26362 [Myriangium duriaei CBS 260.36]|uniref:Uncharacterized protein n=1 Tax=Myriangium duriaei CBS 260.36 TaxID=1168546 RepID=A0A9P4MM23_9PEZI|nr:hypothetical protein K461DRAFT_26362 [Myriangium duriaei CBS 260.36]